LFYIDIKLSFLAENCQLFKMDSLLYSWSVTQFHQANDAYVDPMFSVTYWTCIPKLIFWISAGYRLSWMRFFVLFLRVFRRTLG